MSICRESWASSQVVIPETASKERKGGGRGGLRRRRGYRDDEKGAANVRRDQSKEWIVKQYQLLSIRNVGNTITTRCMPSLFVCLFFVCECTTLLCTRHHNSVTCICHSSLILFLNLYSSTRTVLVSFFNKGTPVFEIHVELLLALF